MSLSPVLLFTYKKVTPLNAAIEALGQNQLASELYNSQDFWALSFFILSLESNIHGKRSKLKNYGRVNEIESNG
ncbi:hypothetical protein [Zobellia alginiliquefaciens]|uniref:hypothetical protein n=1 Tax=Zobellia alginiliquefaciens TaxID=3032586 RepID=UPI0023E1D868|nr:hypothetical protein [Zobellia alginiliquefaciens]